MVGSGPTTASRAGGEGKEDPACFPGSGREKRWRRKEKEGVIGVSERRLSFFWTGRCPQMDGYGISGTDLAFFFFGIVNFAV